MLLVILLLITLVMIIMIFLHYVDFLLLGYQRYRREGGNLLMVLFVIVVKMMLPIAVIAGLMMWSIQPKPSREKTITQYDYYRGISGNFILPYDYPYGDFVIPKGSLINRGGDSSSNENEDVVQMSRLFSVRFPYPVKIAGIKVNALRPYSSPFKAELAENALIGPVYDRQGKKLLDEQSCKQGDIAEYYQPRLKHGLYFLDYVMNESLRDLYFAPDHWLFLGCDSNDVIDVPLPYSGKIGDPIMKGEQ